MAHIILVHVFILLLHLIYGSTTAYGIPNFVFKSYKNDIMLNNLLQLFSFTIIFLGFICVDSFVLTAV